MDSITASVDRAYAHLPPTVLHLLDLAQAHTPDALLALDLGRAGWTTALVVALSVAWLGLAAAIERWREGNVPFLVVEAPEAASPTWRARVLPALDLFAWRADSSLLPDTSGEKAEKYLTCYDPATGYHLGTLPLPSRTELDASIRAAHAAYAVHRRTTFAQRRRMLRCFKGWLLRDLQTVIRVGARDTGKTEVDAFLGEILTTCAKIDYLLTKGEGALRAEERAGGNLLLAHKVSKLHYEPLGVVCAIVSWNYPIHNALSPILAALFTGNTVVLKCSEQVLWSSRWIVGAMRAAIAACGMERDAVQLVCCLPQDAGVITRHELVRHITFIGSEPVGRVIARDATEHLVPCCIELGGKDAALLLPSADVKFFASTYMRAAFQANGQNCIGIERFIVHRSVYQAFLDAMAPRVRGLRCGSALSAPPGGCTDAEASPVDCGAMISPHRFAELEGVIGAAVAQGARVLAGGKRLAHPVWTGGAYFEPTLVCDVTPEMDIARQELFAPVMTVIPYDTVEEGVAIANGTRYGLGAAVFGRDCTQCRWVADQLECGMVAINDFGVFYLNQSMPFGGAKASGYGRFGGPEGLRGLCNLKVISEDRFFSTMKTSIPPVLDYPLKSTQKAWLFTSGLAGLAFGVSWRDSASGLLRLIRGAL